LAVPGIYTSLLGLSDDLTLAPSPTGSWSSGSPPGSSPCLTVWELCACRKRSSSTQSRGRSSRRTRSPRSPSKSPSRRTREHRPSRNTPRRVSLRDQRDSEPRRDGWYGCWSLWSFYFIIMDSVAYYFIIMESINLLFYNYGCWSLRFYNASACSPHYVVPKQPQNPNGVRGK
jgi:hypothetical protein